MARFRRNLSCAVRYSSSFFFLKQRRQTKTDYKHHIKVFFCFSFYYYCIIVTKTVDEGTLIARITRTMVPWVEQLPLRIALSIAERVRV